MEELQLRVVVGDVRHAQQHFVIIGGSVTEEDLAALRRAASGAGEVVLKTEYGPWPFRITQADLAADSFHVVSVPPGQAGGAGQP